VHEKGCPGNSILEAAVASVCSGIALSRGISSWLVSNIAKFETRISAVWTESSLSIEFPGVLYCSPKMLRQASSKVDHTWRMLRGF
jgi:hypothetical protein